MQKCEQFAFIDNKNCDSKQHTDIVLSDQETYWLHNNDA